MRDELKNHYDGVFDEFEIKLVEASGGAFEVYVNDTLKVFSKLNLDTTWFQIELEPITGKVKKICGDSSKTGCYEGNTW